MIHYYKSIINTHKAYIRMPYIENTIHYQDYEYSNTMCIRELDTEVELTLSRGYQKLYVSKNYIKMCTLLKIK